MKSGYIDVKGIRTFYVEQGQGPTLVLMHGASLAIDTLSTWSSNIESLARHFHVVAFDQVGFGLTDMPRDGQYVNRLARVDHALGFVDALGIRQASFAGHSEGGFMATRIALDRPALVSRLIIVTSGATAPNLGGEEDAAWKAASARIYDYGEGAETEDKFIKTNGPLCHRQHPALEKLLRENYRRAKQDGHLKMFQNLPESEINYRLYMDLQEKYIQPHLPKVALPTLLLWAASDPTVPAERGLKLSRILPNADLQIFSGASHMVMWDRAAEFNAVLASWLEASLAAKG
ncbi:MAG: alpha/beta fold hydrolase [Pseudorhodoplanes sp.]